MTRVVIIAKCATGNKPMIGALYRRRRRSAGCHIWDVPGVRKKSVVAVGRRDTITTLEGRSARSR